MGSVLTMFRYRRPRSAVASATVGLLQQGPEADSLQGVVKEMWVELGAEHLHFRPLLTDSQLVFLLNQGVQVLV